jgi:hypothetical protein
MSIPDNMPFLCVITPVFDPAYNSVKKLVAELQSQTNGDFFQVLISNGPSPKIKRLVEDLNKQDSRFLYDEIKKEKLKDSIELLVNLGKRREYCLKRYDAERYLFLDADIKLVEKDYFLNLQKAHNEARKDVLLTSVKMVVAGNETNFPVFPIKYGHIDIANYSFSFNLAKNYHYPTDYDPRIGYGNDYRFFSAISNENNTVMLNFVSAIKDGNNTYRRFTELFLNEQRKKAA